MKGPDPLKNSVTTNTSIQHKSGLFQAESQNLKFRNNQSNDFQNSVFESLDIPNITLFKDEKHVSKEEFELSHSHSSSHMLVNSMNNTSHYEDNRAEVESSSINTSYIIGRATLSYTTKQKIDLHVVSNKDTTVSSSVPSLLDFSMNDVSLLKNEINHEYLHQSPKEKNPKGQGILSNRNQYYTNKIEFAHPYLNQDRSKLVKRTEIIKSITVKKEFLNGDIICKQFQSELNFVNSFIESLQYLDNFSLSKLSTDESNLENRVTKSSIDIRNLQYDTLLSKFDITNIDVIEKIASKNLFRINLLIGDEQRRAKNLLFILKMREDALKDFTKSQILWLENKKKCENMDVTALKKKQRSALLKLQLECGEMQHMRKALLSLSEKRKLALKRIKKDLNLKINMNLNRIILYKKKIKRSCSDDRSQLPLKCFDLPVSGRDFSIGPRLKLDCGSEVEKPVHLRLKAARSSRCSPTCASKCSTRASTTHSDRATGTIAEKYVTVDGTYLNIIFNNLQLPDIFSGGENYEVNEEALKSIVSSANSQTTYTDRDIIEKYLDQIKKLEQDLSSSPSTARSLLEEFDHYYKDLTEEHQQPTVVLHSSGSTLEKSTSFKSKKPLSMSQLHFVTDTDKSKRLNVPMEMKHWCSEDSILQADPLPVPSYAVSGPEAAADSDLIFLEKAKAVSALVEASVSDISGAALVSALSSPVNGEVEELRRQQLEIEREIKAIEHQQSQLLAIREIPDKPPPPYTSPSEQRLSKIQRMFYPKDDLDGKIRNKLLENSGITNHGDGFDVLLSDICKEAAQKYRKESSDKPWDAFNLLSQRHQLVEKTSTEIREVLMCNVLTSTVMNMGSRRSDDIDDILFAEWRHCEPEWTALQVDEAAIKGRIYYSIFQSILNETMHAYEQTILEKHISYYLLYDTTAYDV